MKLTTRLTIFAMTALAIGMTSCKTNESNYRAAYEAAKQKNEESRSRTPCMKKYATKLSTRALS